MELVSTGMQPSKGRNPDRKSQWLKSEMWDLQVPNGRITHIAATWKTHLVLVMVLALWSSAGEGGCRALYLGRVRPWLLEVTSPRLGQPGGVGRG